MRELCRLGLLAVVSLGAGLACSSRELLWRVVRTYPGCVYFAEVRAPLVALTIDDGPDSVTTPVLLDVLAAHAARATFFLISSRVVGNEAVVARMVREGHELGNHLTRDEPSIKLPPEAFAAALQEADSVLSWFAEVRWFRPGSGWYNASMLAAARKQGLRCALGSVYPLDAALPWTWLATQYILANVKPGDIIILHDGNGRGHRTAQTLRRILPALRKRGFRVVTLSELLAAEERESGRDGNKTF